MLRRLWSVACVAAVGVLVSACDPCTGVVACEGDAAVRASGRIVTFPSSTGVSGARVTVDVAGTARTVTTDGDGFWRVELDAPADAGRTINARITVARSPDAPGYSVDDVALPVSRRRGDGTDLGRWYDRPQLRFIGEVRARLGVTLSGATVRLSRTGGVGADVDGIEVPITPDRRFLVEAPADTLGELQLAMAITVPGVARPFQQRARVVTMYRDTAATVQGLYSVGPGFLYRINVLRRVSREPLAGVSVTFWRQSGPKVVRDSVVSTTDATGFATLPLQPLESGEVVGRITLRRSGLPAEVINDVRLPTIDDDSVRFAGAYRMGVQLASVVELFQRTSVAPLAGVTWTFTPVSGPLTTPLTGTTDAAGLAGISAVVNAAGTVRGDLAVNYLPPRSPEVFRGLSLVAQASDTVRRAGYFGVGPSLLYLGIVRDAATSLPIAGATAEFRRTGGIAVTSAVFTSTSTAEGLFVMSSAPLADGEVEGDLTFRLPAPYRDTTFTGIRLQTFLADDARLGGTWFVRRP